jgi:hypothetical protein
MQNYRNNLGSGVLDAPTAGQEQQACAPKVSEQQGTKRARKGRGAVNQDGQVQSAGQHSNQEVGKVAIQHVC